MRIWAVKACAPWHGEREDREGKTGKLRPWRWFHHWQGRVSCCHPGLYSYSLDISGRYRSCDSCLQQPSPSALLAAMSLNPKSIDRTIKHDLDRFNFKTSSLDQLGSAWQNKTLRGLRLSPNDGRVEQHLWWHFWSPATLHSKSMATAAIGYVSTICIGSVTRTVSFRSLCPPQRHHLTIHAWSHQRIHTAYSEVAVIKLETQTCHERNNQYISLSCDQSQLVPSVKLVLRDGLWVQTMDVHLQTIAAVYGGFHKASDFMLILNSGTAERSRGLWPFGKERLFLKGPKVMCKLAAALFFECVWIQDSQENPNSCTATCEKHLFFVLV